jgi:flavin reductase (DIM6/NTAB) family NADH-FMN oxidoreductase RutF
LRRNFRSSRRRPLTVASLLPRLISNGGNLAGAGPPNYYAGVMPRAHDADRYRTVMGRFPTGVAIVTCAGPSGPAGMTTNAVTSLSLDPLLLLVCFDNASRTLPVVRESRRFAVNVLRAGQEDLARVFASKRIAREKFEEVTHTIEHGVPVLDDPLAWVACDLLDLHPAGDHTIGIGAVTHMDGDGDGEPLVFFRGAYTRLLTPSAAPATPGTP